MFSGLTANTSKKLQLDAGAFFKNYDLQKTFEQNVAAGALIGATSGGGSFSAVPTVRQIEIDGIKGATKGFETIDEWVVNITANVKEISKDVIKMALIGGTESAGTGYDIIKTANDVVLTDYIDNVTWCGRLSGSNDPVIIVVKNALCTNGLTLTTADKAEGVIALTLTGHYDPAALDVVPFEIHYPTIA